MKARWRTASSSRSAGLITANSLVSTSSKPTATSSGSLPRENCCKTDLETAFKRPKTLSLRALIAAFIPLILLLATFCSAQTDQSSQSQARENQIDSANSDADPTIFPHPNAWPFYIGGQVNMIFQAHPPFHAKYSGTHSFQNNGEHALSRVATLYLGWQATRTTELLLDVEETGGRGISD